MFENCSTIAQLCNEGPIEASDMATALRFVGAKADDIETARALANERMFVPSVAAAVERFICRRTAS